LAIYTGTLQVSLSNRKLTLYSVPPPGSGVIMAYILNILDLYNITRGDETPLLYHRYTSTRLALLISSPGTLSPCF
jgi:hypothetical protein